MSGLAVEIHFPSTSGRQFEPRPTTLSAVFLGLAGVSLLAALLQVFVLRGLLDRHILPTESHLQS